MSLLTNDPWWKQHFRVAFDRSGFDYISTDGSFAVEVKESNQGLASFHAGIMQLANALNADNEIKRACLLFNTGKLSLERIKAEWNSAKRLFRPSISSRLGVLAFVDDAHWFDPDEEILRRMAISYSEAVIKVGKQPQNVLVRETERYLEIVKVLLIRWLRHDGPLAQKQLAEAVGCSYPTLRATLQRLEKNGYLIMHKNRQVELAQFPYDVWQDVLAIAPKGRQNISLVDTSRTIDDPMQLHKRLKQQYPADIALGGVIAARYWDSRFNLNGIPRLDIVVHVPQWYLDLSFLHKLDPALRVADDPQTQPILVVHPLQRAMSYFTEKPHDLPIADPVETALDLVEMGLTQQVSDLFHHFRKEVRLT